MKKEEYEQKTKLGYKDSSVAREYKKSYESRLASDNFRTKIIAQREKAIVGEMLSYLKENNDLPKNILDIPAGTGKMTRLLLDFGIETISADISEEMLKLISGDLVSHKNYRGSQIVDVSDLPFEDGYFEAILNIRLMHRVSAEIRRKSLIEAKRVARKYIIISFAINSKLQKIRLFFRKIFLANNDPSPGKIEWDSLKKEIGELGFEIIKKKNVFPFLSNEIILLIKKVKK